MKASELIKRLEELKAEHGDLEVGYSCMSIDPVMDAFGEIEKVEFDQGGNIWTNEDLIMLS